MKKKLIIGLTMAIVIGTAITSYAATNEGLGLAKLTGKRGYEFTREAAENKYKVSQGELDKAREEGKSVHEYLEEKGISEEDFEKSVKDSKKAAVDQAVKNGKLSKEEGDKLKKAIDSSEGEGPKSGAYKNGNGAKDGSGFKRGTGNGNNGNCIID